MFKKDNLERLQKRSNRAVKVFSHTASNLASINLDIEVEQNKIALEQEKLTVRDEKLQQQKEKNKTLLTNINKFLGLE